MNECVLLVGSIRLCLSSPARRKIGMVSLEFTASPRCPATLAWQSPIISPRLLEQRIEDDRCADRFNPYWLFPVSSLRELEESCEE